MVLSALRAYLANTSMQDADTIKVSFSNAGTPPVISEHVIVGVERFNGSETSFPAGVADGAPYIVIHTQPV